MNSITSRKLRIRIVNTHGNLGPDVSPNKVKSLGFDVVEKGEDADIYFVYICSCCSGQFEMVSKVYNQIFDYNHESVMVLYGGGDRNLKWIGGCDILFKPTVEELLAVGVATYEKCVHPSNILV